MTKLILVSHGPFAESIVKSIELILGKCSEVSTFGLYHGDSAEKLNKSIREEVLQDSNDILFLTDLFGGTPNNEVAKIIHEYKNNRKMCCFTGMNLPLLLEVMTKKDYYAFDDLINEVEQLKSQTIFNIEDKLIL